MKISKLIKWLLIGIGGGMLLLVVLLITNNIWKSCDVEDTLTNDKCVYTYAPPEPCKYGGTQIEGNCVYDKQGYINRAINYKYLWYALGILLVAAIGLAVYIFLTQQKSVSKREEISVDKAKEIHRKKWATKYGMYTYDGVPPEENFIDLIEHPFIVKNGERFVQTEQLIQGCRNPYGNELWTFVFPLSRGEKAIYDSDYIKDKIDFHRFQYKPNIRPLFNIQDAKERLLQSIIDSEDPEAAKKYMNIFGQAPVSFPISGEELKSPDTATQGEAPTQITPNMYYRKKRKPVPYRRV